MSPSNTLNEVISVRLTSEGKQSFSAKCEEYQVQPQDMIREMIDAFVEGKLRIIVPKTQLRILKGIHHVD